MIRNFGTRFRFKLERGPYSRSLGYQDEQWISDNLILQEGERNVLDSYFRNQNNPPQFFLGLHSGSLTETATLANVVEPSQSGYARILYNRNTTDFPTLVATAGDDFRVEGAAKVFTAAATWTPVNKMFLASLQTGLVGSLIVEADLGAVRALLSQDTLTVTPKITAQEV